jgi:hypothetical protein
MLAKSCVVLVFLCTTFDILNHGGHRGNMGQALAQWRHPVASSESLDVLHWAMCPTLHHSIPMAVKNASVFPAYVCIFDFVLNHNRS